MAAEEGPRARTRPRWRPSSSRLRRRLRQKDRPGCQRARRGEEERELIVVDTPGHDDPAGGDIDSQEARDVLGAIAADLHNKLKALGEVHTILVLHNDVVSNRLNPATYQILKMARGEVPEGVVLRVGARRDRLLRVQRPICETSWRSGLEGKKKSLQASIKEKMSSCAVSLPVIALGGGEIDPPGHDEADGLEKLWEFLDAAPPLDSAQLQPFEGADVDG